MDLTKLNESPFDIIDSYYFKELRQSAYQYPGSTRIRVDTSIKLPIFNKNITVKVMVVESLTNVIGNKYWVYWYGKFNKENIFGSFSSDVGDLDSIKTQLIEDIKKDINNKGINNKGINIKEESMETTKKKSTIKGLESYDDVTYTFKNYPAFKENFMDIQIVKVNGYYLVFRPDAVDYNDYKYSADSKDNIEGWLYGMVQAKNKRFENLESKNEEVQVKTESPVYRKELMDAAQTIYEKAEQRYKGSEINLDTLVSIINSSSDISDELKDELIDFFELQEQEFEDSYKPVEESLSYTDYSKPIQIEDKWFRYNYKNGEIEYITHSTNEFGPIEVIDSVKASEKDWNDVEKRKTFVSKLIETKLIEDDEDKSFIIALSNSQRQDIANGYTDYDAYIYQLFTEPHQLIDDTKVGYSTTTNKNEAERFTSENADKVVNDLIRDTDWNVIDKININNNTSAIEESISISEGEDIHAQIEGAEDMDEIQGIIGQITDEDLGEQMQLAFDQCIEDEDDLDTAKGFLIATFEDNAEYDD